MSDDQLIIRKKQLRGEDGYRIFSVRLRESIVSQLDRIAKESGRSRNELTGIFLEYGLKHYKLERGDADVCPKRSE